eukprot:GFUD01000281.1.p1 GENE.GFUD01000281.1~~GFUD01000281.1.p1  ORF type:complete len:249 (+),score=27.20 GFUD01000281.1:38-748(+)
MVIFGGLVLFILLGWGGQQGEAAGFPKSFEVASFGAARNEYPNLMGVYLKTGLPFTKYPVYRHTSQKAYLYVNSLDDWVVNVELNLVEASLYADTQVNSDLPPSSGWQYFDGSWKSDTSLSVTEYDGQDFCIWTDWFDRDDPGWTEDYEVFDNETQALDGFSGFPGCNFKQIEMRVVGTTAIYTTEAGVLAGNGDIVHITNAGMYCKWTDCGGCPANGEQPDGTCFDYEVRFCCLI